VRNTSNERHQTPQAAARFALALQLAVHLVSWRDSRGKQHQQSTETANPAEALSNKLKFLAKQEHEREDFKAQANEMGKLPLERVAELYFNWKAASSSPRTIERERRIFARC